MLRLAGLTSKQLNGVGIRLSPTTDYFVVGTDGNFLSGASQNFGVIHSDYVSTIVYNGGQNPPLTGINLNYGTYTGFSVDGMSSIDGDTDSDLRIFTIGGVDRQFRYYGGNSQQYIIQGDPISLATSLGQTITIIYDPAIQPTPASANTITVDSIYWFGTYYYGVDSTGQTGYFGGVKSDYIKSIIYTSSGDTQIKLKNGTYSGFTVANGAIDSDTSGSTRVFTIDGVDVTLTNAGPGFQSYYQVNGDGFSLSSKIGQTLNAIYDTAKQGSGGGGGDGGGTTFTNLNSIFYAMGGGPTPTPIVNVQFTTEADRDAAYTALTTIGSSFDAVGNYIDPNDNMMYSGNYTFIIDGSAMTGSYGSTQWYIQVVVQTVTTFTNTGSTLPPGSELYSLATTGSGGGSSTTYTAGTDYGDGQGGPPGISFSSPGGPYTSSGVYVLTDYWTTTVGSDALLALAQGDTFTVSAVPAGGGSAITSTITLLSNWTNPYGTQWRADMSSSPEVSTSYPNYIPLSVTVGSGGAVPVTVPLVAGFWSSPPPHSSTEIILVVNTSETAGVAALDALASNAQITLTDSVDGTTTVTISGTLTKGSGGPYYQYMGNTVESNTSPGVTFQNLVSTTV